MSVKKYSDYISVHEEKTKIIGFRPVEEMLQIDEISSAAAKSYINKSGPVTGAARKHWEFVAQHHTEAINRKGEGHRDSQRIHIPAANYALSMLGGDSEKRLMGHERAQKRIKENVDPVNEAKKNGLGWTKSITGASSHNYARGSYLLDHEKPASEIAYSIEKAKQSGDIVSHEVETQDSGTSQHIISLNPKKFKNTKIQINTDKKKPGGMSWVNLD